MYASSSGLEAGRIDVLSLLRRDPRDHPGVAVFVSLDGVFLEGGPEVIDQQRVGGTRWLRSEYSCCPPGRPEGRAFQERTAAAANQIVRSPRRRSDFSYAAQFRTRYFVLYFSVTLLFVRAAILVVSGG